MSNFISNYKFLMYGLGGWLILALLLWWIFGSKSYKYFVLIFVTSLVFFPFSLDIIKQKNLIPLSGFNIWSGLIKNFYSPIAYQAVALQFLIHSAIGPLALIANGMAIYIAYNIIVK